MKIALAILAVLAVLFIGTAGLLGLGYISFSNQAASFEVDIKAQYSQNQNVYDNGYKKVLEIAQVPAMQATNLAKLYDTAMKGREGADGSRALVQFVQEQNPTLDNAAYEKIQQTIEVFRNNFEANQTRLISHKQEYERFLTATTTGRIYNLVGHYPRIDLSVYDIMTSDQTDHDFKTKRGAEINLNSITTTGAGSSVTVTNSGGK